MVVNIKVLAPDKIRDTYIFGDDSSKENFSSTSQNGKLMREKFIHDDDTIFNFKNKIIEAMDFKVSYGELYVFSMEDTMYNLEKVYDILTQNGNVEITQTRLFSFLENIDHDFRDEIEKLKTKTTYEYEDLLELGIPEKVSVRFPVGLKYNIEKEYPFVVNPFDVFSVDIILKDYAENIVTTQNSNLLLDYKIKQNTYFVCLAEDVINYAVENDLDVKTMIKIYFPFLYKENILSLDTLEFEKQKLLDKTKKNYTENYERANMNTDMMYLMYNERKSNLEYISQGIKSINFVIHPVSSTYIPIDLFIKSIQTSETNPLIKLNNGKRGERIFRLFTDNVNQYGKRIPVLDLKALKKINKNIATRKSVGFFLNHEEFELFTVEFYENGNVEVEIELKSLQPIEYFEEIIKENVNELLKKFNKYFENNGYSYELFTNFNQSIEFKNIEYNSYLSIKKKVNIKKYLSCISNIFTLVEDDFPNKALLNYKKVSNFQKMNNIDNFITVELKKETPIDVLTQNLIQNFDISEDEAKLAIGSLLDNLQVEQNVHENKKLKIKSTPGFAIYMSINLVEKDLFIRVENIDNIRYINHIAIYLDSLVRLTQDKQSTEYPVSKINSICGKKKIIEEKIGEDIKSSNEKSISEFKKPVIEENKITFEEEEEDESGLDFLKDLGILDEEELEGEELELEDFELEDLDLGDVELEEVEEKEKTPIKEKTPTPTSSPSPKQKGPEPKEEEEEEEEEEDLEKDIVGMSLSSKNNPILSKLYKSEPKVFIKENKGKFLSYSRACPSNLYRQPIVLTQKEKDKIDKEHPGSYHKPLHYGTNPKKKHWYICPRYWCLKDNTSLTEAEVKAGVCGGKIIPKNAKTVPKDAFIMEFYTKSNNQHVRSDGSYADHAASFLERERHPDNLCMPCCFKLNKDMKFGKKPREAKENCIEDEEEEETKAKKTDEKFNENYIKEPVKFPLKPNNHGFIHTSLEKMFNQDNNSCIVSDSIKTLKQDVSCLLRLGVEQNRHQSFIAILSNFYSLFKKKSVKSIENFKKTILKILTIDIYISLQNGNLIDIFYDKTKNFSNVSQRKMEKILEGSNIYKELLNQRIGEDYFNKVLRSYLNFMEFINNPDVKIDYTYLWDFTIKHLFGERINMVIFNIPENDVTNNVEIICPTNHYSKQFFNPKAKTIFIVQKGNYFEPILSFKNNTDKPKEYAFSLQDNKLSKTLRTAIKNISEYVLYCIPEFDSTYKNVYKFESNINAEKIASTLTKQKIKVNKQILNLNNQVIALEVNYKDNNLYIPTRPSNVMKNIDIVLLNDYINYNSYIDTRDGLQEISKKFKFPFAPKYKIIEDGLVVGILTNTNQVVSINEPSEIVEDNLEIIDELDSNTVDSNIGLNTEEDEKRVKTVRRIKLENNFFSAFRNTIKILLANRKNIGFYKKIDSMISEEKLYLEKYNTIVEILKELMKNHVVFTDYSEETLNALETIIPCNSKENEKCETNYCLYKDDSCHLVIPKTHLFTGSNNEEMYYGKIADELIRYDNFKAYVMGKNKYLSIQKINYNLSNNEVILLENSLEDYFKNLVAFQDSKYAKYNSFETVEPIDKEESKIMINLDKTEEKTQEDVREISDEVSDDTTCEFKLFKKLSTTEKERLITEYNFPNKTAKKKYKYDSPECSFEVFEMIISIHTNKDTSIDDIKEKLIELYETEINLDKLQERYKREKKIWDSNMESIREYISSKDFYLTQIDVSFLMYLYELPVIMFKSKKNPENEKDLLTVYNKGENTLLPFYYVIKINGTRGKNVPILFDIYFSKTQNITFESISFSEKFKQLIKETSFDYNKKLLRYFK